MTHVLNRSLMCAALAVVFTIASSGSVLTQDVASSDDIPAAGAQTAAAYYEAATGNLFISVGSGLISVGLEDTSGGLDFSNAIDTTALGAPLSPNDEEVVYLNFFGGTLSTGVFNIGQLLAPDTTIETGADFAAAFPTVTFLSQIQGQQPDLGQSINVIAGDVLLGDVNCDGAVDFADIPAFIAVLQSGIFQEKADIDESGVVAFSDIPAFIDVLISQ